MASAVFMAPPVSAIRRCWCARAASLSCQPPRSRGLLCRRCGEAGLAAERHRRCGDEVTMACLCRGNGHLVAATRRDRHTLAGGLDGSLTSTPKNLPGPREGAGLAWHYGFAGDETWGRRCHPLEAIVASARLPANP